MKISQYILLACWVFLLSAAQKETDFSKILPGVLKVTENVYYDEVEVTNLYWLEYLYWTKKEFGDGSSEYMKVYPDTNVWKEKLSYNLPYAKYYLRHEAYRSYPVVGVSWEQARDYCTCVPPELKRRSRNKVSETKHHCISSIDCQLWRNGI